MLKYPSFLPLAQATNLSIKEQLPVIRSKMADGYTRQRMLYSKPPKHLSLTFKFNDEQLQQFESFIESTLEYTGWFMMPVPTAKGIQQKQARVLPKINKKNIMNLWDVKVHIEYVDYE